MESPLEDDYGLDDALAALEDTRKLDDPAELAAEEMLAAALTAAGAEGIIDVGGMVVIVAPSPAWCDVLTAAFESLVLASQVSEYGPSPGIRQLTVSKMRANRRWKYITQGEKPKFSDAKDPVHYLRDSHGVVVVCYSPSKFLSPGTLAAADLRLVIGPPNGAAIRSVAEFLGGRRPTLAPTDRLAARLGPDDLRACLRRGQTPEDYVQRVVKLAAGRIPSRPPIRLSNLAGMDEAVKWGESLSADLQKWAVGGLSWAAVDRGALLAGPPGVGKTTFARALAATAGVELIASSFAKWDTASKNGYLSDLLRAMREDFEAARKAAPCILFVDELDAIPARGGSGKHDDYWRAVVTCLLECLDGIGDREGVVVVAATNHPGNLDPALVRAGRLDRVITIPLPHAAALAGILRHHLDADLPVADLMEAGREAEARAWTGADAEKAVRGARRAAREAGRAVAMDDLLLEIRGPAPDPMPPAARRRIAVHEAGHAVLAALEMPGMLTFVELKTRGTSGGRASIEGWLDDAQTDQWVGSYLRYVLGGRAAEEVLLDSVSLGSGGSPDSDLAKATSVALTAVGSFGLGRSLVWLGTPGGYERMLPLRVGMLDEADEILKAAYSDALEAIRDNFDAVERVASILLERGHMTGAEVDAAVRVAC